MTNRLVQRDQMPALFGVVGLVRVNDKGLWRPVARKRNQIQVEYATILIQAAFQGNSNYRISAMYLEFENVDSPEDAVTAPSYSKYDGIEYYAALADSPNRDFLRIPFVNAPKMSVMPGYESYFANDVPVGFPTEQGNRATCFTLTQGTSGVHGKPYTVGANSKVFGLGLVATPAPNDPTQDLLFARTYFAADEQAAKESSNNIGATWEINFTL